VTEFTINVNEIVELVEATRHNAGPPPPPVTIKKRYDSDQFEDPAIVSVGRRPLSPNTQNSLPTQWTGMERVDSLRTVTSKDDRPPGRDDGSVKEVYNLPVAQLVEPMHQVDIAEVEADAVPEVIVVEELEAEPEVSPVQQVAKPAKRSRRRKNNKGLLDPDAVPVIRTKETSRSKGWRQTPLLEPNPTFQPFSTLNRKGRRGTHTREDTSGWGTEDATDVQEMGDFNFADNLAKFDKQSVFTQLQAEDGIADGDRLVAHNRLSKAKPGTGGGKNLAYNENVLDSPNGTPKVRTEDWDSEASDLDERFSQKDTGSGRVSRRAESKIPANRRATSRKGSSTTSAQQLNRALSVYLIFTIAIVNLLTLNSSQFLHKSQRSISCHPISYASQYLLSRC
jgi:enhancer of mRNA-decapping protein 3